MPTTRAVKAPWKHVPQPRILILPVSACFQRRSSMYLDELLVDHDELSGSHQGVHLALEHLRIAPPETKNENNVHNVDLQRQRVRIYQETRVLRCWWSTNKRKTASVQQHTKPTTIAKKLALRVSSRPAKWVPHLAWTRCS